MRRTLEVLEPADLDRLDEIADSQGHASGYDSLTLKREIARRAQLNSENSPSLINSASLSTVQEPETLNFQEPRGASEASPVTARLLQLREDLNAALGDPETDPRVVMDQYAQAWAQYAKTNPEFGIPRDRKGRPVTSIRGVSLKPIRSTS